MQPSAAKEDECRHARKPAAELAFPYPVEVGDESFVSLRLYGALIVWVEPSVQPILEELKHVGPAEAGCLTAEIAQDAEVLSLPEVTIDTHGCGQEQTIMQADSNIRQAEFDCAPMRRLDAFSAGSAPSGVVTDADQVSYLRTDLGGLSTFG